MKYKTIVALLAALVLCLSACGTKMPQAQGGDAISPAAVTEPSAPKEIDDHAAQIDAAAGSKPKPIDPEPTPDCKPIVPEASPEQLPPEEPSAAAAALTVSNYCAEAGHYTDNVGNDYDYSFTLPKLSGADTPAVRAANEAFAAMYTENVCPVLDEIASGEGQSLVEFRTEYSVGTRDDVISIMVARYNDWGCNEYSCWNFTTSGEAVSNGELLERFGLSEEEFTAQAYGRMEPSATYEDTSSFASAQRERTLSGENCNAAMPMYISPAGKLCFVGRVYSIAGADSYDYLFEL